MIDWLETQSQSAENYLWALLLAGSLWLARRCYRLFSRAFTNQQYLNVALKDISEAKKARAATNTRLERLEQEQHEVNERLARMEGILSQIAKS